MDWIADLIEGRHETPQAFAERIRLGDRHRARRALLEGELDRLAAERGPIPTTIGTRTRPGGDRATAPAGGTRLRLEILSRGSFTPKEGGGRGMISSFKRDYTAVVAACVMAGASVIATAIAAYSAHLARGTSELARDTADSVTELLEFQVRPLVIPIAWGIETDPQGDLVIHADLKDVAEVRTVMNKVCVWQGNQPAGLDRRYLDTSPSPPERLVFGDLQLTARYPAITRPSEFPYTTFLSIVYTFSREGATARETWRAEAWARLVPREDQIDYSFATLDMLSVDEEPC